MTETNLNKKPGFLEKLFSSKKIPAQQEENKQEIAGSLILGSSSYLECLGIEPGYRFLTINVTGDCNNNCAECRVDDIRKETAHDKFTLPVLQGMNELLHIFKKTGGYTVCVMAYGEPLVGENLDLMIELAKITGKLDLFLIVNTNGVSLSQTKIEMLDQLNPNIVFQVSYNSFEIHSNRESWFKADSRKEFIKKHQKQMIIKNTTYNLSRFVLHTYVTPSNVDRMFPIKQYADSLGAALIVTEPGITECNEKVFGKVDIKEMKEVAREYSDNNLGATALHADGQCAYISRTGNRYEGITLYPGNENAYYGDNGNTIGIEPYFRTFKSYSLQSYQQRGGMDIEGRYKTAQKIVKIITDKVLEKFGNYYCLKRHARNVEISEYLQQIDKKFSEEFPYTVTKDDYFEQIEQRVSAVLDKQSSQTKNLT